MTRRNLLVALLLCGAGAGLGLFAVTRGWAVELLDRPAPLPRQQVAQTGGDLLPWLPPLALAGLAGAGAVVATRGAARRLIGVLLLLVGLALVGGGAYGVTLPDRTNLAWPVLCALGGLLTAGGGARTALRGHHWPGMGARYERRPERDAAAATGTTATGRAEGLTMTDAWDALDRGEDPTDQPTTLP